jgi:hypothetical protein
MKCLQKLCVKWMSAMTKRKKVIVAVQFFKPYILEFCFCVHQCQIRLVISIYQVSNSLA